jgi:hypothetical protein
MRCVLNYEPTLKIASLIVIVSCQSTQKEERTPVVDSTGHFYEYGFDANAFESFMRVENYLSSEKIDEDDWQLIDVTSALLINPTEEQIIEMEEAYGEDDLVSITDDNGYFQSIARHILDSLSIKTLEAEKRFIKLVGQNNKTWLLDIRKPGAPAWNLILFNIHKDPEIIPVMDLTSHKVVQYFDVHANRE